MSVFYLGTIKKSEKSRLHIYTMKQIVSAVGDNYIHIGGYSTTTTTKTTIADIASAAIAHGQN